MFRHSYVGCSCVGCSCMGCSCVGCSCMGCSCVGCSCMGCSCVVDMLQPEQLQQSKKSNAGTQLLRYRIFDVHKMFMYTVMPRVHDDAAVKTVTTSSRDYYSHSESGADRPWACPPDPCHRYSTPFHRPSESLLGGRSSLEWCRDLES